MRIYVIYCFLCAAATLALLAGALWTKLSERAVRRRERRYARRYMQMITHRMLNGEAFPMCRFPMCDNRGAREVLARLLAAASSSTSFEEPGAVRRIVAANGIEGWLLRRVRLSHGYRRAHYLAMLAALPVSHTTAEIVRRYSSEKLRCTRFRTMLVGIAAEPSAAVRLIGEFPFRLTHLEMAELTSMLRRGMLPLAYAPLLASDNINLRMLGLDIVRIFGIAEAEPLLLDILAGDDPSPEADGFRDEALYVLVSLHLPVSGRRVAERIRSMPAENRHALFRRLAAEGYSVDALMRLAADDELAYIESLAASYKRTLVCHSRI